MKKDLKSEIVREPVICTVIAMLFAMIPCAVVICFRIRDIAGILHTFAFFVPFWLSLFFAVPFILTAYNLIYLFLPAPSAQIRRAGRRIEYLTAVLGFLFSFLWAFSSFSPISFAVDWYEDSFYLGTPLAKEAFPTVAVCIAVAVAGYGVLRFVRSRPTAVTVLCFGAMYVGIVLCALWIFQVIGEDPLLCLAPFNFILIAAKVMKEETLAQRERVGKKTGAEFRIAEDGHIRLILGIGAGAVLMIGISALFTLFGQDMNNLVLAWTDTAGWPLSRRVK